MFNTKKKVIELLKHKISHKTIALDVDISVDKVVGISRKHNLKRNKKNDSAKKR